jgi:hypothetical protein
MDGSGSESYPMADFDTGGVESSDSATRESVSCISPFVYLPSACSLSENTGRTSIKISIDHLHKKFSRAFTFGS